MSHARSIVDLLGQLVRTPSRAGIDPYQPIVGVAERWLAQRGVACRPLLRDGQTVALVAQVERGSGPTYMLNATLDTAGYGDESAWSAHPASAVVRDGWLYGRGSADSKAGVAIFCQLAAELSETTERWGGTLVVLFDLDEHTGGFAGARSYFEGDASLPRPEGVFIGYPGDDRIVVGSRGFLRATLTVRGQSAHSGGASARGVNAVTRAARLVGELTCASQAWERDVADASFPLPPKLTVTAIHGGAGFAMVPDRCDVLVDVRLTPRLTADDAQRFVTRAVRELDADVSWPTDIRWHESWPAYRISEREPFVHALRVAAERELGRPVPVEVVGPSNIGNYLHQLGIPATCGFGVKYRAIHAVDECVDLSSLEPVYRTYRSTLRQLFDMD